jgi:hypothetical protein
VINHTIFRPIVLFGLFTFTFAACEQTMVFGEKTGFNLGVAVDTAKSSPIEINTGFRRQIVGIIPASEQRTGDVAKGEATNMISRFEMAQTANNKSGEDFNAFDRQIVMSSAFASGKAAVALVGGTVDGVKINKSRTDVNSVVNKIAETEIVRVVSEGTPSSDKREVAMLKYIQNPNNFEKYRTAANRRGIVIPSGKVGLLTASGAIGDPNLAAEHVEIAKELNIKTN